jgi:hypothetical protein
MHCELTTRKPVSQITDRARRQRSRKCIDKRLLKRCGFCGGRKNMRVHHLNGIEADTGPENLIGACHACNARVGWVLKRYNIGRLVDLEYKNPEAQPAKSLTQWMMAVKTLRGESNEMQPREAIAMIRATSPGQRSAFAHKIWELRRQRGTDRTAAPF